MKNTPSIPNQVIAFEICFSVNHVKGFKTIHLEGCWRFGFTKNHESISIIQDLNDIYIFKFDNVFLCKNIGVHFYVISLVFAKQPTRRVDCFENIKKKKINFGHICDSRGRNKTDCRIAPRQYDHDCQGRCQPRPTVSRSPHQYKAATIHHSKNRRTD
jgi:hypothetical protein